MSTQTEYAKEQEKKHKRKIVLPCVIPWEYGSNKYATQKGSGGFGNIRNATTKIESSRNLSKSNDGVVPLMNCPSMHDKKLGSQSGLTPFGGFRENAFKVREKEGEEKKDIHKMIDDKVSEGILKIWSKPNPDAKIEQPFGKHRDAVLHTKGGRQFSEQELNASRAAIPKFQDQRQKIAANAELTAQVNRKLEGAKKSESNEEELDFDRYMAWIGGQLTLQRQLQTNEAESNQDLLPKSYFNEVMNEREYMARKKINNNQRL